MAGTLVAFQTHLFDLRTSLVFKALRRSVPPGFEAVALVHLPPGAPVPPLLAGVPHHLVRTPDIRPAAYGRKAGLDDPGWTIWGGGHTDLPFLHLALARPGYGRYWSIEYDVRFAGPWQRFFGTFEASGADFLATRLRTRTDHPTWELWDTLALPEGVALAPGVPPLSAFLPIYRASRRMVEAMDGAYRTGWAGHCEVVWPTVAQHRGFAVEDMGGNGEFVTPANRGKLYDGRTFSYKPVKHLCWRRNMLWHPVKPLGPTLREDLMRAERKLKHLRSKAAALLAG